MRALDEEIARSIRASELSGEMRQAKGYGKPLDFGDGYAETPEEFRMSFKILKDAGFVPAEVLALRELSLLREQLARTESGSALEADLKQKVADLQLRISLRLETMRASGSI